LTLDAAHRRLQQELGLDCELHEKFVFRYRAEFTNQLIENEYDHVFVGECSREPLPNVCEVQDWRWISLGELKKSLQVQQAQYTYWLRIAIDRWPQ
jgi:isopentenyl-diphosphate delta-isomerase